jgi:hypothetical protein
LQYFARTGNTEQYEDKKKFVTIFSSLILLSPPAAAQNTDPTAAVRPFYTFDGSLTGAPSTSAVGISLNDNQVTRSSKTWLTNDIIFDDGNKLSDSMRDHRWYPGYCG